MIEPSFRLSSSSSSSHILQPPGNAYFFFFNVVQAKSYFSHVGSELMLGILVSGFRQTDTRARYGDTLISPKYRVTLVPSHCYNCC